MNAADHLRLATFHAHAGNRAEAWRWLRRARALSPESASAIEAATAIVTRLVGA